MTVINYASEWTPVRGRPRYRQDVHGIATDAPPEGINLQQPERAA